MKTKYAWLALWIGIALIVGGILGYWSMPEKIVTKTIASNCQACPEIPTKVTCSNILEKCPVCKVSKVCEKCTYEKAANEKIQEKKNSLKTKVFSLTSSRTCESYKSNKNIVSLPVCIEGKKITALENLTKGCKISYLAGQC